MEDGAALWRWEWSFSYGGDEAVVITAYRSQHAADTDKDFAVSIDIEGGNDKGFEMNLSREQARDLGRFLLFITE